MFKIALLCYLITLSFATDEDDIFRIKTLVREGYEEDLTIPPDPSFKVSTSDINLYFYTRYNYSPIKIPTHNTDLSETIHYDPSKKHVFIIHGWKCNHESDINNKIRNAVLRKEDVNVFVVDWSKPAGGLYVLATFSVPKIGKIVGDYINQMITLYQIPKSQFYLIGHSLGAHIAGCIGANVQGLHSIVGLDPAGPLFTNSNTDNRLDRSDAEFVHVIHTNAKHLGFSSPIGHADYYPDGGEKQHDCGLDIFGTCSHSKSYEIYALSIYQENYVATQCDSYKNYQQHQCDENSKSLMGGFDVDRSASGQYYLSMEST
ncbi:lipase member H-like [Onthophagus taurus]|uniref:lipase member H-like n=1 Tax=Onthophagus taurus TaxID=166361 RepID=UPI0039BDE392